MVFATLGVFSLHGSVFDLGMLAVFGLMGYVMRCADVPVAPAIIGLILGPLAEQQLRRALAISQGDPTVFLTRPLSATILAIALAVFLLPPLYQLYRRRSGSPV
jgi:putative tricarboxylic transport membrane protein